MRSRVMLPGRIPGKEQAQSILQEKVGAAATEMAWKLPAQVMPLGTQAQHLCCRQGAQQLAITQPEV